MPSIKIASQGVIEGIDVPLSKFSQPDEQCKAGSVTAYLGIPFAQPPVGPLRWKKPQRPAPSWDNVRQSAWQADPFQDLALAAIFGKPRGNVDLDQDDAGSISEDCLFLNLFVPANGDGKGKENLPILCWIYGGSFLFGGASTPTYDGARLCHETGCIVVTVNYRVGVFGWLGSREMANRAGEQGSGTGNYGAWDVIAALEWVQENIKSFGGDASNVTAFGESAGSIIIHHLLLSPETPPNLFSRAVLESGTALTLPPRSMPVVQAQFNAIVDKLSPSTKGEDAIQMLYDSPAQKLWDVSMSFPTIRPRCEYQVNAADGRPEGRMDHDQSTLNFQATSMWGPTWDGVFVSPDFLPLVKKGLPEKLSNGQKGIVVGFTTDEGSIFAMPVQSVAALKDQVSGFHKRLLPKLKQIYGLDSITQDRDAFHVAGNYIGDLYFQGPIRSLMLELANQDKVPCYGYLFAHRPSTSLNGGKTFGALHTAEIAFFFGNDGSDQRCYERETYPGREGANSVKPGFTPEEKGLSLVMMRSLGKFAEGTSPWISLQSQRNSKGGEKVTNVKDCHMLVLGKYAMLGSPTPASVAASESTSSTIPIGEQRLGDTLTWTEKVGPTIALDSIGSQDEKHAFWTAEDSNMLHYYGDNRITFVP
jgi:carboxylesterase type B